METLEVNDLRARRRILAVIDQTFPVPVHPDESGGLSCETEAFGEAVPDPSVCWREPLFEIFRETYGENSLNSAEFRELVGEWITVRSQMTEDVRVELFAMTLAWSEWSFAWSRRF